MAATTANTALLKKMQDIFKQADENGIIIAETVMLACGLSEEEAQLVKEKGLKEVPVLIQNKIKKGELTDEKFLDKLFTLELSDLEQLPISFYADMVKSQAFLTTDKQVQEYMFSTIFKVLGIDDVQDIANMEAERVAYNHRYLKDIFDAYTQFNPEFAKDFRDVEAKNLINKKLDEMIDKVPELRDYEKSKDFLKTFVAPYKAYNGDLEKSTEAVLGMFDDTRDITLESLAMHGVTGRAANANINTVGLDQTYNVDFSNTVARAGLAQYKLGALKEALVAKKRLNEQQAAENFSVVDPKDNNKPVNKLVNSVKNVMAYYSKPQNVAKTLANVGKVGVRQVLVRGIQHFIEATNAGVSPGPLAAVGAGVGLAMKLTECAYKISLSHEKPSKVFADAASDLVRGTVTVGTSLIGLGALAGPIGAVAGVVTKGIKNAHEEGCPWFSKEMIKRVGKEFTKGGNVFSLVMSGAGAVVGYEARKAGGLGALWDKIRGIDHQQEAVAGVAAGVDVRAQVDALDKFDQADAAPQVDEYYTDEELAAMGITREPDVQVVDQENPLTEPGAESADGIESQIQDVDAETENGLSSGGQFAVDENGHLVVYENTAEISTEQIIDSADSELSYAEQYIQDHPGAHFDKNGWVQNADGSYARNAKGQLFGSDDRVFRALHANETHDKFSNIIEKPAAAVHTEVTAEEVYFNELNDSANKLESLVKGSGRSVDDILGEMEKVVDENPQLMPEYERMQQVAGYVQEKVDQESIELPPESKDFNPQEITTEQTTDSQTTAPVQETAVNPKTFENLGYDKTADGVYTIKDGVEMRVVHDTNQNGIPDEGDTYAYEAEIGHSKIYGSGEYGKNETRTTFVQGVNEEGVVTHVKSYVETAQARTPENVLSQTQDQTTAPVEEVVQEQPAVKMPEFEQVPVEQEVPVQEQTTAEPELEVVHTPLTVRSPEELAKIDALQAKANQAHDFNSLPEHWQKELIEIKAKGIVAQEQGDTAAYEAYKKEFDTKFRNYVDKDRELDRIAKQANIKGTREYEQRQRQEEILASHGTFWGGKEWTQEEWEAKYKAFTEKYGEDMGTGKNGVRQYVRYSGGFKEEVPDVPERNFAELGYQQQKDGTWILKNRFTTKVVTDVNHNGIPDAGDTYEQVTEIGKPGSSFYSREHSSGQYIEPIKEQINPNRNAQTELEKALARERARVSEQTQQANAQEQTASVLIPQFEPGSEK